MHLNKICDSSNLICLMITPCVRNLFINVNKLNSVNYKELILFSKSFLDIHNMFSNVGPAP